MNNQTVYWLWIQQALGYGSGNISYIIENYTFAEDFYRASFREKLMCGAFSHQLAEKLRDISLDEASRTIDLCLDSGIDIITIGDVYYPKRLMQINNPPAVLFVKGRKESLVYENMLAMVGTRNASAYGTRNAFKLSFDLAKNGFTIVSGGALGIDTYSHKGVLQADGSTVCILGCGINYRYLQSNAAMREQILRKGAVISEYAPDVHASKYTFPLRNRIISGMSKGVLVVEAGKKSGSLITVELAMEQGRDVFAVPGDISSSVSMGTNELIKDGAIPVTSAEDVVCCYSDKSEDAAQKKKKPSNSYKKNQKLVQPDLLDEKPVNDFGSKEQKSNKNKKDSKKAENKTSPKTAVKSDDADKKAKALNKKSSDNGEAKKEILETNKNPVLSKEVFEELSENEKKVLVAFDNDTMHIDTIAERTGIPIAKVHSAITRLEMNDYLEACQGRSYKILVSVEELD